MSCPGRGRAADATPTRLHITVEDTGIGIPADKIEHIFGEFNQVETRRRTASSRAPGWAWRSRAADQLMGGEIWVDSEEGRGATFGFRSPCPRPSADPRAARGCPGCARCWSSMKQAGRAVLERQLGPLGRDGHRLPGRGRGAGAPDPARPTWSGRTHARHGRARACRGGASGGHGRCPSSAQRQHRLCRGAIRRAVSCRRFCRNLCPARSFSPPFAPRLRRCRRRGHGDHRPPDAAPVPARPRSPTPAAEGPRAMRVLAAEDNKTNRLVFSKMVKSLDIDLRFAENGAEAVALYQNSRRHRLHGHLDAGHGRQGGHRPNPRGSRPIPAACAGRGHDGARHGRRQRGS